MQGLPSAVVGMLALALAGEPLVPAAERALLPPRRIEAQLSANERHVYVVSLEGGQFLRLTVHQQGTDLGVAVVTPRGGRTEIDVASDHVGHEPASLLAAVGGTYRVELTRKQADGPGTYALLSEPLRVATGEDRSRFAAERALAEGVRLSREARPEAPGMAMLDQALQGWRALPDAGWEAETLMARSAASQAAGEHGRAIEDAEAALRLLRAVGERRREARALQLLGEAYYSQHDYNPALGQLEEALALHRAFGDRRGEAETLASVGWTHSRRGDVRKHLEIARQVVALRRDLGDRQAEVEAVETVGRAHSNAGDVQQAIDMFREVLSAKAARGDRAGEATALNNLASMHEELGDSGNAIDAYTALPLAHPGRAAIQARGGDRVQQPGWRLLHHGGIGHGPRSV